MLKVIIKEMALIAITLLDMSTFPYNVATMGPSAASAAQRQKNKSTLISSIAMDSGLGYRIIYSLRHMIVDLFDLWTFESLTVETVL